MGHPPSLESYSYPRYPIRNLLKANRSEQDRRQFSLFDVAPYYNSLKSIDDTVSPKDKLPVTQC